VGHATVCRVGIANPVALHLRHDNLGGGLHVIVDLFVVIDNSVSGINKLAGADERVVARVETMFALRVGSCTS
jgi:hypothetical protein